MNVFKREPHCILFMSKLHVFILKQTSFLSLLYSVHSFILNTLWFIVMMSLYVTSHIYRFRFMYIGLAVQYYIRKKNMLWKSYCWQLEENYNLKEVISVLFSYCYLNTIWNHWYGSFMVCVPTVLSFRLYCQEMEFVVFVLPVLHLLL